MTSLSVVENATNYTEFSASRIATDALALLRDFQVLDFFWPHTLWSAGFSCFEKPLSN